MTIGEIAWRTQVSNPPMRAVRVVDFAERAVILATFAWYMAANLATYDPLCICIASTDAVTVWCVLFRRRTDSVSLAPLDLLLAFAGTVGSMFARPGGTAFMDVAVMVAFYFGGLAFSVAAKLSLNRRFGVAPANRGVQHRGAYAFVRHPMYLGYALVHVAYLLLNPTWFNLAIYVATWACQWARILREERWLFRDPAYRAYAKSVRFRLIPGLV